MAIHLAVAGCKSVVPITHGTIPRLAASAWVKFPCPRVLNAAGRPKILRERCRKRFSKLRKSRAFTAPLLPPFIAPRPCGLRRERCLGNDVGSRPYVTGVYAGVA